MTNNKANNIIDIYNAFWFLPNIQSIDISNKKEIIIDCGPVLGIRPAKQIEINIGFSINSEV